MFNTNNFWLCPETIVIGAVESHSKLLDSLGKHDKTEMSENLHYAVREKTAIIDIIGLIVRYDDFFSMWMGGVTSLQFLITQINKAQDDDNVDRLIFNFDTAGGDARGLFEATEIIRNVTKPTVAYVESQASSAGYLLASACNQIVAADVSYVGSVGAIISVIESVQEDTKITSYVSSISKNKNLGPGDEHFDAAMQARVDLLANRFIDDLAVNLKVERDFIINNFGQGDSVNAVQALAVGMISEIGNFESLFNGKKPVGKGVKKMMTVDEMKAQHAALYNMIVDQAKLEATQSADQKYAAENENVFKIAFAEGREAESKRLLDIDMIALPGHEALIAQCKEDSKISAAETAIKIIAAEKVVVTSAKQKLDADNVPPISGIPTASDWDENSRLKAEFGDDKESYEAYMKAKKNGQIKL